MIHTFSANFIYEHKELAFSLANDVYMFLTGEKNTDVLELQKLFIYDQKVNYPVVTNVDTTTYTINSQITKNNFNFYNSRRKGLLKNIISPINENL